MTTPRNGLNWVRDGINKILTTNNNEWTKEELDDLQEATMVLEEIHIQLTKKKRRIQ